jgi:hypothetical protein
VNSPPPKPEVILTNFFAEPTVLLVPITSREIQVIYFVVTGMQYKTKVTIHTMYFMTEI